MTIPIVLLSIALLAELGAIWAMDRHDARRWREASDTLAKLRGYRYVERGEGLPTSQYKGRA